MSASILITGAMGYIGHHLRDKLKYPSLNCDFSRGAHYQLCISELAKFAHDLQDIETVFHLADRRFNELSSENINENIERHQKFFRFLETLPNIKRVIFASSCSVYGYKAEPVYEDSKLEPTSFYAQSKVATEKLLQESSLPYIILRFGTAYGMSENTRYDLLINYLISSLKDQIPRTVFDLHSWRPYIHCQDFAAALIRAMEIPERSIVNIVESNITKAVLIEKINRLSPRPLKLELQKDRNDARNYIVHSHKANDLGFTIRWPLDKGLSEVIEAHV